MTRQQYRASAALAAGWYWDWLHSGSRGEPPRERAWRERTEAEVIAERDAAGAASLARYLATPTWTPADSAEDQRGRDPRRVLALRRAVRAEAEQAEARAQAKRLAGA